MLEGLIPVGALVVMAGSFGSYKSTIAREMAAAIATGQEFGGHDVLMPYPVLYLDRENSTSLVGNRVKEMRYTEDDFQRPFYYWSLDLAALGLDMPILGSQVLLDWAVEHKGLIIFDSLVRFHSAQEKDNTAMAAVMGHFTTLARTGATVIVLHHRGKSREAQYRGAEDIIAAADIGYTIQRDPDDNGLPESQFVVEIESIKNRFAIEGKRRYCLLEGTWRRVAEEWRE